MHRLVLVAVILAITASTADARRRHRIFYQQAPVMLMAPGVAETRFGRARIDSPAQLVPRGWELMPPDPNWQGRRYVSPERDAWLAFYATNAANDAQARFKAVAFGDAEDVTYLHGARDRLTVSGLKGDNIFYRKVTLACGGTIWRHVAMEYPATAKAQFDRFVERMSRGFERIADDACGDNLFSSPQPASAPAQPKPDEKPAAPN